ncbi:MFS transporter [Kordiimonas sediminis]|uniref:MFS transporter n=1 Tax=Kordiimonas sediminis TaxID=1735581 RepID=A0A919AL31_9PROT|nr:transcription antitermination factor NusB [Kordiimonas sediminis]GHF14949.1 MFS transporter [Kordiimonas sediminis]
MSKTNKNSGVIDPTGGITSLPAGMDVRLVAAGVLFSVLHKGQALDTTFDAYVNHTLLNPKDRSLAYQIVMQTLRRKGGLEAAITPLLKNGWPEGARWFPIILMTAATQILLLRTADHAAVDLAVGLLKRIRNRENGLANLMNAILRTIIREKEALSKQLDTVGGEHLPAWLSQSWEQTYGADTRDAVAATLTTEPYLDITCRSDADAAKWAEALDANHLFDTSIRRDAADVTALDGFQQGQWWVQDFAASMPVRLFGSIADKHVLDLCAAPGGKTLQLASLGARVTAVDRNPGRLKRLQANLNRTGLQADIITADVTTYTPDDPADHILLDAPCSATGTFRRNPDVLWTKFPEDVAKLATLQKRALQQAFSLLPKGGTLIYCVCSLEHSEGADQINTFLQIEPAAKRVPIQPDELVGFPELISADGDLLCLPSMLQDKGHLDGFFAARLTRV